MKSGEKTALWAILISIILIAAVTVYLETEHQKNSQVALSPVAQKETSKNSSDQTQLAAKREIIPIPKGMNPDDLPDANNRGATVLTLYCTQCHDLPTPAMHTAPEWQKVLVRMDRYLREKQGGMLSRTMMPPKQDWLILSTYLANNAQTPLVPERYADISTPPGQAFLSYCSQCHQAPSPAAHTGREWPRVVLRMKSNIIAAKRQLPDPDALAQIVSFLQSHASDQP